MAPRGSAGGHSRAAWINVGGEGVLLGLAQLMLGAALYSGAQAPFLTL